MTARAADRVPRHSLRLGFAGTPAFAVAALDALCRSAHRIEAVYTRPDRPAGRGQKVQVSPVKARAEALGIPVHQPESFNDDASCEQLETLRLDALVVVAYGSILPVRILSAARIGCFNIHASLLPRWRGAAPIERALLAGDTVTGVSIMRMEQTLDTGPVLAVRRVEIDPADTAGALHDRLAAAGAELIGPTLDALAAGTATETVQPREGVSYAQKISKREALIDWQQGAAPILRQVRAFNPRPVAETRWNGAQLRIWEASPGPPDRSATEPGTVLTPLPGCIEVACGDGTVNVRRLQLAGRKPVTAAEFVQAHDLAGARFNGAA